MMYGSDLPDDPMYGDLPDDLGYIGLVPIEMKFWMYCPISVPGDHSFVIPDNLREFIPIVRAARWDNHERFLDSYVYLTAKTLWVGDGKNMNRPGWHSDGFGTDDVNYIWSDRVPTEFLFIKDGIPLSEDCAISMEQMRIYALRPAMYGGKIVTFPDKHLLRLTPSVIHRAGEDFEPGMRTFVKVSVSSLAYNLIGNSINHGLPIDVPMVPRQATRNHPAVPA